MKNLSGRTSFNIPVFPSVCGTDTTLTKEIKEKKAQWGNPLQKFMGVFLEILWYSRLIIWFY